MGGCSIWNETHSRAEMWSKFGWWRDFHSQFYHPRNWFALFDHYNTRDVFGPFWNLGGHLFDPLWNIAITHQKSGKSAREFFNEKNVTPSYELYQEVLHFPRNFGMELEGKGRLDELWNTTTTKTFQEAFPESLGIHSHGDALKKKWKRNS